MKKIILIIFFILSIISCDKEHSYSISNEENKYIICNIKEYSKDGRLFWNVFTEIKPNQCLNFESFHNSKYVEVRYLFMEEEDYFMLSVFPSKMLKERIEMLSPIRKKLKSGLNKIPLKEEIKISKNNGI